MRLLLQLNSHGISVILALRCFTPDQLISEFAEVTVRPVPYICSWHEKCRGARLPMHCGESRQNTASTLCEELVHVMMVAHRDFPGIKTFGMTGRNSRLAFRCYALPLRRFNCFITCDTGVALPLLSRLWVVWGVGSGAGAGESARRALRSDERRGVGAEGDSVSAGSGWLVCFPGVKHKL